MTEPLFGLALSLVLVSVSLAAVLVTALPALQELARAARSAEKLFDSLNREFPPTLEAIRLTGLEISELTDELDQGVKNATEFIQTVDQGLTAAKATVTTVQGSSQRFWLGFRTAWQTWQDYPQTQYRTKVIEGRRGREH